MVGNSTFRNKWKNDHKIEIFILKSLSSTSIKIWYTKINVIQIHVNILNSISHCLYVKSFSGGLPPSKMINIAIVTAGSMFTSCVWPVGRGRPLIF